MVVNAKMTRQARQRDYFRERVWDSGFLRNPKSNLQWKCSLFIHVPLMKKRTRTKGGGSLNSSFSLG